MMNLPVELQDRIKGASLHEIGEGMSGAKVYRIDAAGCPAHYLKIAARHTEQDLQPELARLLWLKGRLPAPEVTYWGEDESQQYLMMRAVPGVVVYAEELRPQLDRVIELYAAGLRQIHAVQDCPFDARLDVKIAQAKRRAETGAVDVSDLDPERQERTAESLFQELLATRPSREDLVFTHGDYCTPNVLIDPDTMTVSGFIDWGRAGIADRYQDLALAARSIAHNFGDAWIKPFFDAYGIREIDEQRVAFYRLLDEFF